jgi:hypothetical protein
MGLEVIEEELRVEMTENRMIHLEIKGDQLTGNLIRDTHRAPFFYIQTP